MPFALAGLLGAAGATGAKTAAKIGLGAALKGGLKTLGMNFLKRALSGGGQSGGYGMGAGMMGGLGIGETSAIPMNIPQRQQPQFNTTPLFGVPQIIGGNSASFADRIRNQRMFY